MKISEKIAKHEIKKKSKCKEETKVLSKKGVVISSLVAGVAVVTGIAATLILINPNLFPPQAPDYSKLNINELEDDTAGLYKKYMKNSSSEDFTNDYKPYELVNIALKKAEQLDSFRTTLCGSVKASIATQLVNSTYIKDGNEHFYENISTSSFVKVGLRFYQDNSGVELYKGNNVTSTDAKWDEANKQEMTISDYDSTWGKDLSRRSIYIISSKTTLDTSSANKTESGYKISLDLDPVLCSARYVKQIVNTSGLEKDPIFKKVNLTYTLDNDLNIQNVKMSSEYTVYMVTYVDSNEELEEIYYYNENASIPSLSEDCIYKED